jgi:hypothetical protein
MPSLLLPAAAVETAMESGSNGRGVDPGSSEEDYGTGKEMEAQHGEKDR